MKAEKAIFSVLEFSVILLLSWISTYGLEFIEFVAPIDAFSLQNLIFLVAIVLSFSVISHYNKIVAFMFSLLFSIIVLLPLTRSIVLDLPLTAFLLATMFGVLSVILIPAAKGKEFFVFLAMLVLPFLLAESKILGWISTQELERSFQQIYFTILALVSGCLYLRYTTKIKLTEKELLLRGGEQHELMITRWWSSFFVITIIGCAMSVNALLARFVTGIMNQFNYQPSDSFVFLMIFAGIVGVAILVSIYVISDKSAIG